MLRFLENWLYVPHVIIKCKECQATEKYKQAAKSGRGAVGTRPSGVDITQPGAGICLLSHEDPARDRATWLSVRQLRG